MTMEAYSSSYYSSSKSSYLSQNPDEAEGLKNGDSFQSHALLRSVRKSQAKPWKKAPVAPPAPTPVKVYNVDPLNFRDLVQQLTGAPEFKPQLLHRVAPTAATALVTSSSRDIAAASSTVSTNNWYLQGAQSEALGLKSQENTDGSSLLELNLSSPSSSSYNWCSFPPMSPGTHGTGSGSLGLL